jgi:hypothetical protein
MIPFEPEKWNAIRSRCKCQWIIALVILLAWDTITTLMLYRAGRITEANPLLRGMIENNPGLLVIVKFIPVGLLAKYGKCIHVQITFWLYLSVYCALFVILNWR